MIFKARRQISVRTVGDPVLSKTAAPILSVTPETVQLANEMLEALRVFNGIGIAAPQYGVSLRLVVLDVPEESMEEVPSPGEEALLPRMPLALVNPEILSYSTALVTHDEGCLSVPDLFAPVTRPQKVVFRAQTLEGEVLEYECGGLLGRCIQHELDHLEGKLFIDRLSPETARETAGEVKRLLRNGAKHDFLRTRKVK